MTLRILPLRALLLSLAVSASLLACDDDSGGAAPDAADAADAVTDVPDGSPGETLGGWSVDLAADGCTWTLTPPGSEQPVLQGPPCAEAAPVALVASGTPSVTNMLGAFQIDLGPVTFREAGGGPPELTSGAGWLEMRWSTGAGDRAGLRFSTTAGGHLRIHVVGDGEIGGGRVRWLLGTDEAWFGLGAQVTGLDLRGHLYPLWTQEQGIGKPEDGGLFPLTNIPEAAYAPMGVWHTTAGWSGILDVDAYTELDLTGEVASLTTWRQRPGFVVIATETPRARMAAVTEIVGRIEPPAPWVFGPWNDAVGGPERLEEVSTRLREEAIPSSAIWSEDWIGGEERSGGFRLSYEWDWDPEMYPDLPNTIAELHELGFAFLGYFNPFVIEGGKMWDEGLAGGFLIEAPEGGPYVFTDPASRDATLVDLTNPDAVDWLKGYLTTAAEDLAIDGWMADFAEWLPADAVLHDGDPWVVHNRYPLLWQQANYEAMEAVHGGGPSTGEGWVFFARSGWASTGMASAGLTPTMWGGDQDTDWARDDGLPSVIPIGVNLGLAGVPIFGSDIAGYSSFGAPPTDKELFFRWTALGAFHPLMRTHHGSSECANWAFDRDDETVEHFGRWARVHTLLYPYFQALAEEATAEGLPMMRHPWLVEPHRADLWDDPVDAFFLGDDVWVAPVVEEGATERTVLLPGDGWWPLFGDERIVKDDLAVLAHAAPTEIPVYVRPGTILPLLRRPVDSFYGAEAPGVSDLDDVTGEYRLALYPDLEGGLDEVTVGDATVRGSGFTGPLDWSGATLDGEPLQLCDVAAVDVSCTLAGGGGALLFGASMTLQVDGATLEVDSETPQAYRVGLGGEPWGELASPTPFEHPDPDIPPPCE
ncbi:MAG: TIM-barrel domain-containing protein [Myxococcota bacterium]